MQIWLKGSGQTLRIPVLPDSYTVTSKQNNTVVNVTALGDINLLGNRGLLEIEWSKFFPKTYDETYCEYRGFPSPAQCVKRIETMKRHRGYQVRHLHQRAPKGLETQEEKDSQEVGEGSTEIREAGGRIVKDLHGEERRLPEHDRQKADRILGLEGPLPAEQEHGGEQSESDLSGTEAADSGVTRWKSS